jgi:hypothetical protein
VQAVQFRIADRGSGGIVWAVDQDQFGIPIREFLDFFYIEAEVVFFRIA